MELYNDYNVSDNDIREYYGLDDDVLVEDSYDYYIQDIWDNFIEDLQYNFEHSKYYIAKAIMNTHYAEFYKNGSIGYKLITNLTDISAITQDYSIIEYDEKEHAIKMTSIGHDNNYDIVIKPLNKQGTQYVDRHDMDLSYDEFEKLFIKHTKRLKEVK